MTPSQTQLYWRTWASVVRAHGWRGDSDALHCTRQPCFVSPALDAVYQAVWHAATDLACLQDGCNLTAEALRHAVHVVALGRDASSKQLTNAEFDRVLALFRLLAEPDKLAHLEAWESADAGERRRHLYVIRQAAPAYWQRICRDRFGHCDLDRLPLESLRQFSLTLRERARTRAQRAETTAPVAPVTIQLCPV